MSLKLPLVRNTCADEPTVAIFADQEPACGEVRIGFNMHIGTRKSQQDAVGFGGNHCHKQSSALAWSHWGGPAVPRKSYAIVCDGMGGLQDGDKASQLCVAILRQAIEAYGDQNGSLDKVLALATLANSSPEAAGGNGSGVILPAALLQRAWEGTLSDLPGYLEAVIDFADSQVLKCCGANDSHRSGTTLVAAVILDKLLHWACVGDSRLYIIRDADIVRANRDHNLALELRRQVRGGRISAEEARSHPKRDSLLSYIGSGSLRYVDINSSAFVLAHGDVVLLCSDGLTKSLSDQQIKALVLENYGDMDVAAARLTAVAFDSGNGAKDNTSVVLMQYLE